MRPTLVTGANGHVGNNICRLLVAARRARPRHDPRQRRPGAAAGPRRRDRPRRHPRCGRRWPAPWTAAGASTTPPPASSCGRQDPEHAIIRPSVDGTRNVMKAAAKAGVEKVLYVSTSGTIGCSTTPDGVRAPRPTTTRTRTRRTSSARSRPRRRPSRSASAKASPSRRSTPASSWARGSGRRASRSAGARLPEHRHADLLRRRLRRGRRRGRRHRRACSPWTRARPASATSFRART